MDTITLTGLRARGHHGVYDVERAEGQEFVADVVLELDLAAAADSDDVADTVDYGELAQRLTAVISGPPVNLIETLAERLAGICLADGRVVAATVTVHKPQAPLSATVTDVAVTIRRRPRPSGRGGRRDYGPGDMVGHGSGTGPRSRPGEGGR